MLRKGTTYRGYSTFEKKHQVRKELASSKTPFKGEVEKLFAPEGKLRPFRLLKQDVCNIRKRYIWDWTTFNRLVLASAVYVFSTNMLPEITFASYL